MSVYVVTGKLGNGKGLITAQRVVDYLRCGRRVATNVELYPEAFPNPWDKNARIIRIPDKPTVENLNAIGRGHDLKGSDESRNGLLLLDECGTWFNSRSWNDPSRAGINDWFLHVRKLRWDLILIIQDIDMLDKYAKEALAEHVVYLRRTDRIGIPFIGGLFRMLGFSGKFPKAHVGIVKYGQGPFAPTSERWWSFGDRAYSYYDTEQVFTNEQDGVYSLLTPWHLVGRYNPKPSFIDYANKYFMPFIRVFVMWPVMNLVELAARLRAGWRVAAVSSLLLLFAAAAYPASFYDLGCVGVSESDCRGYSETSKIQRLRADSRDLLGCCKPDPVKEGDPSPPFFSERTGKNSGFLSSD